MMYLFLRQVPWNLPVDRVRSSDAAIVIYSIVDRLSFHSAREALDVMATLTPSVEIPVLLLANKTDLNHLRKVNVVFWVSIKCYEPHHSFS